MKSFSQRKGFKPVTEAIQYESMNSELRNSLWNALDAALWATQDFIFKQYGPAPIETLSKALWFHYFKKPVDSRPSPNHKILAAIRDYFLGVNGTKSMTFLSSW